MVRSVKIVRMVWITKNIMDERWEGDKGKKLEVRGWRVEIVNSVKIVRIVEIVNIVKMVKIVWMVRSVKGVWMV
jgi:hypothetical protein